MFFTREATLALSQLPAPPNLRILVTGSRVYSDAQAVEEALCRIADGFESVTVCDGRAQGADDLAFRYTRKRKWSSIRVSAKWRDECRSTCSHGARPWRRTPTGGGWTYCPAAGIYRNQEMVALGHDVCVGFLAKDVQSTGTMHCMSTAFLAGIPTLAVSSRRGQWVTNLFTIDGPA